MAFRPTALQILLTAMGLFNLASAATVKIDVDFCLTKFESSEGITNRELRLVFGQVKDWQSPQAGHKFATDNDGRAHFTVDAAIDRRWISVPVAQTGVSVPKRSDHLWIGAELEQFIQPAQGPLQRHPWLHCFEIDNISAGESSTSGFNAIYGRDARGSFPSKVISTPDRLVI
jgi:hypothetical protein